MGQTHSSNTGTDTTGSANVQKCYYEILGLDPSASDDEIKRSYRKKALELHPDRNLGNVEETTKLFAEVQAAYEILSDPQEKAWYDAHRDSIIHGQPGSEDVYFERNVRVTTAEDITRLYVNFNGRFEYSDATTGFFSTLREFFDTLVREEHLACKIKSLEAHEYPSFGSSKDTYDDTVKEFYLTWSNFSTQKSFSWRDTYRYSDAPDRRTRRFMEKENHRLREEGIRDFNTAVRALVAFVRKRDPRYVPNTQSDEERNRVLRELSSAQAARSRAANLAKWSTSSIPEWSQTKGGEIAEEFQEDEDSQDEVKAFECIICKKVFKSENQYEAHEKSKKHQKAAQQLFRKMHRDNLELGLTEIPPEHALNDMHLQDDSMKDSPHEMGTENKRSAISGEGSQASILDDESSVETESRASIDIVDDRDNASNKDHVGEDGVDHDTHNKHISEESSESEDEEDDYAPRKDLYERLTGPSLTADITTQNEPFIASPSQIKPNENSQQPRIGKAKAKRARKQELKDKAPTCGVCQESFTSRTQLFRHIEDLNHATAIPELRKAKDKRK